MARPTKEEEVKLFERAKAVYILRDKGMNQNEIASAMGIAQPTVSDILSKEIICPTCGKV